MGLVAASSGSSFTPAPAGTHVAICCQIVDLGDQHSDVYNKTQHKVLIGWELANEKDEEEKPFLVWRRYTLSIHEKATLGRDLESWRGKKFTDEERKGFSLKNLLGKPCMLNLIHSTKDGQTYANIQTVMALPKGTVVPPQTHPTLLFDIDTWDPAVFATFGDNLKKLILGSAQGKARSGTTNGAGNGHANGVSPVTAAEVAKAEEDDIPF